MNRPVPARQLQKVQSPTASEMLDIAERLAQTRGFNGFSYHDIAAEMGITKAGLHYHFSSKAELGRALVERYSRQFNDALDVIRTGEPDPRQQLRRYVQLYSQVLDNGRICLCGMLAAEYSTLPAPMQLAIRRFFDDNERWLTQVFESGRRARRLAFDGRARNAARVFIGSLEGAMLLSRPYGEPSRFAAAAAQVLGTFERKRAH